MSFGSSIAIKVGAGPGKPHLRPAQNPVRRPLPLSRRTLQAQPVNERLRVQNHTVPLPYLREFGSNSKQGIVLHIVSPCIIKHNMQPQNGLCCCKTLQFHEAIPPANRIMGSANNYIMTLPILPMKCRPLAYPRLLTSEPEAIAVGWGTTHQTRRAFSEPSANGFRSVGG